MMANNSKKTFKRKNIIFGSMFVISSLLIMIAVSFSWFYDGTVAKVSGITFDTVAANNLRVKLSSESDWGKKLNLDFSDALMQPVSGDGDQFFSSVIARNEETDKLEIVGFEKIDDIASYGVFEKEISFIVENPKQLNLMTTSFLAPADGDITYPYDVDAGHICSALRVAIMVKDSEGGYALKYIWIPNAKTEILYDSEGALTVDENGTVEDAYKFRSSAEGDPFLVETDGASSGIKNIDGVQYVWGDLEEDLSLCEMEAETPVDVKFVIWLDGEDRECREELISGQVKAKFDFTVVDKETEAE
jgi:hypothetical protein